LRSANADDDEPTDISSSSGYVTGENGEETVFQQEVKVIDRFMMILMIFAH